MNEPEAVICVLMTYIGHLGTSGYMWEDLGANTGGLRGCLGLHHYQTIKG